MRLPKYPPFALSTEILPEFGPTVAVPVFADESRLPQIKSFSGDIRELCEAALAGGEFKGEEGTTLWIRGRSRSMSADNDGALRLLLVGLGARAHFREVVMRRAAAAVAREVVAAREDRLNFLLPSVGDPARVEGELLGGLWLGLYDNRFYRNEEEDGEGRVELTRVIIVRDSHDGSRADAEHRRAAAIAESVNWARALADEPGLSLPPREFARRAAEMAAEFGLKVESLTAEEIRARGMGGLIGVGQGSDEEPALIVVRYEPDEILDDEGLWAFVGKGITFDTGGISIKHGLDMYEMKADMAGGAAVLGALRAAAQLKPRRRLVGIVPAAENMPSGRSIKPGDIVRTLAGHTIEVVDTDAEGRLVLVDGIAYARQLGAQRIVDLATLTGSIIVALGTHRTGLFSNDDAWAAEVTRAAERAGEPVWRMPVSDDYKQRIESPIADFKNYGGKPDATAAALLLSKFAGETPWVHLDIAGTSWYDDPQPHAPKGSTGTGVRTLVELVCGEGKS